MKIAYYVRLCTANNIRLFSVNGIVGILKKIVDQVDAWKNHGHEVTIFVFAKRDQNLYTICANLLKGMTIVYIDWNTRLEQIYKEWLVMRLLLKYKPDLLYFRLEIQLPIFIYFLKRFHVVAEANTDIESEIKEYSFFKFLYYKVTEKFLFKNIHGLIFVTSELKEKICKRKFNGYAITIGNGINLNKYEESSLFNNKNPSLCFLASAGNYFWNDLEQIITFARFFPQWQFHIIGNCGALLNPPGNVKMHGFMSYNDYKKILSIVDVGIGTLALYRKKMNEGATLKVREYLAIGLPVIIGHVDVDFPTDVPFILRLPNRENNLLDNKEQVEKFVYAWMGKRVARKDICHLDVSVKEKQRLAFFTKCLSADTA